jgi:hypothetical protein
MIHPKGQPKKDKKLAIVAAPVTTASKTSVRIAF